MSWGIAESATDFEKLRAESADFLNGWNSCSIIRIDRLLILGYSIAEIQKP